MALCYQGYFVIVTRRFLGGGPAAQRPCAAGGSIVSGASARQPGLPARRPLATMTRCWSTIRPGL